MPVTEPLVQMILPCKTCGGTGERAAETFASGGFVISAGGGKLRCRDCDGSGGEMTAVPIPVLAEAIAHHQNGPDS